MDIYVLDKNYNVIDIIDNYKSCIWTNRYCDVGDFELYIQYTDKNINNLQTGNWLVRDEDRQNLMLITTVKTTSDESDNYIIATGKSAETLLERRIIIEQTNLNDTVTNCVKKLVNDNIISPSNNKRKIDNIGLGNIITSDANLKKQITYDNLLEAIKTILCNVGLGFNFTFKDKKFYLNVYSGENNNVVFSSDYDNLIDSEFIEYSDYKNVAVVCGEGEGVSRKKILIGDESGVNRKELYVDARDISSDTDDGELTSEEYKNLLESRGVDALSETHVKNTFETTVSSTSQYKYKIDYDLGDIVKIKTDYNISAYARIIEIIESYDADCYTIVPTLENLYDNINRDNTVDNALTTENNIMLTAENNDVLTTENIDGSVKISELAESYSISNNDLLVSVISNVTKKITYDTIKTNILDSVYPIGSIYMSVNNTNPSSFFGGTWVTWGSGRVPVGVNTVDSNFNYVEKAGGSSTSSASVSGYTNNHALTLNEIPSHNHGYKNLSGTMRTYKFQNGWSPTGIISDSNQSYTNYLASGTALGGTTYTIDASHQHQYEGGDCAHNHYVSLSCNASTLQSYITCYMWKRTN